MALMLEKEMTPLVARANTVRITNDAELTIAKGVVQDIKAYLKRAYEELDPQCEATHKAHQVALDQKRKYTAAALAAEKWVKKLIADYLDYLDSEKKRKAQLAIEAAKKEQAERLQIMQNDIQQQLGLVVTVEEKIEALLVKLAGTADADRQTISLINTQLANLYREQDKIDEMASQSVKPTASMGEVILLPVMASPPKIKGVSTKMELIPEVTNPMGVVKAVASGQIPLTVIEFNMQNIKRLGNAGVKIPGVTFTSQRNVSVRRAG